MPGVGRVDHLQPAAGAGDRDRARLDEFSLVQPDQQMPRHDLHSGDRPATARLDDHGVGVRTAKCQSRPLELDALPDALGADGCRNRVAVIAVTVQLSRLLYGSHAARREHGEQPRTSAADSVSHR